MRCFSLFSTIFSPNISSLCTQQNINYVSLMEVLAASFSNLQLAQQQQQQQYSSLAQSNMNFSHPDEPPLIPAASLFFPPPAQPNTSVGGAQGPGSTTPLLRHIPACAGQSAGSARTSGYSQPNLPATSHGESVNQVRLTLQEWLLYFSL